MIIVVLMSDLLPLSLKEFRLVSFFFPYVHIYLILLAMLAVLCIPFHFWICAEHVSIQYLHLAQFDF